MTINAKASLFYMVIGFFFVNYYLLQLLPVTTPSVISLIFSGLIVDIFFVYFIREIFLGNFEKITRKKIDKNKDLPLVEKIQLFIPGIVFVFLPMSFFERLVCYPSVIISAFLVVFMCDYRQKKINWNDKK